VNKKSDIEMNRLEVIKVNRTLIRLKHSLAADREINEVIPDRLQKFDSALNSGELLQIEEVTSESFTKAFIEDTDI
jgi:hypothetical protein